MNTNQRLNKLISVLPTGKLAKNSSHAIIGQILRAVAQGITFILITRFLQAEQFGLFTASLAIVLIIACLSALAFPSLLVIEISKNPSSAPINYRHCLRSVFYTAPPLVLLTLFLHSLVINDSSLFVSIFLLAIAELVFLPLIDSTARVYQAFENMKLTTLIHNTPILLRLVCIAAHVFIAHDLSILTVAVYYCLTAFVAAAFAVFWGLSQFKLSDAQKNSSSNIRTSFGLLFAASQLANKSILDVDKAVVATYTDARTVGIYAAGYRLVELSIIPIRGILETAYNRMMRAGDAGLRTSAVYTLKLMPWPLVYAVTIGAILYAISPAISWLLGDSYQESAVVIQLFCAYPIVFCVRQGLIQILESSKLYSQRLAIFIASALINLGLTIVWVQTYGWEGAIWASYAAELSLIALSAALIYSKTRLRAEL